MRTSHGTVPAPLAFSSAVLLGPILLRLNADRRDASGVEHPVVAPAAALGHRDNRERTSAAIRRIGVRHQRQGRNVAVGHIHPDQIAIRGPRTTAYHLHVDVTADRRERSSWVPEKPFCPGEVTPLFDA